ncbi:hypothetical protein RhiirA5_442802 [Rhizophagus irregularis]|uniref:Uncharacterized protein n=1 Tax=Rhizophagus irregularis TaxID=588596 RepID=A0A2N0NEH4_9GLOM|nr:hypothetical protein RhiirA5_442802 [Rhizophagus irregularis]
MDGGYAIIYPDYTPPKARAISNPRDVKLIYILVLNTTPATDQNTFIKIDFQREPYIILLFFKALKRGYLLYSTAPNPNEKSLWLYFGRP